MNNRILLTVCIFLNIFFLFGCEKTSESAYELKVKEFDNAFGNISKDFYQECENSLNNQKPSKDLYDLYEVDIDKMIKAVDKLDENNIPKDKVSDLKNRKELLTLVMKIAFNTQSTKITEANICNQFKSLYENKNKKNDNSIQTVNQATNKPDLEIINKQDKYVDEYDYAIIGEVKNNRDYPMRNVFIRFNLYDKDKKLLGDAIDRIDVLDTNGIWKFKASILSQYQKDFSSYKVVELTGYR